MITLDRDFGALIFSAGAEDAGLVMLPNVSAEQRIALMERVLALRSADDLRNSVVTMRGALIRSVRVAG